LTVGARSLREDELSEDGNHKFCSVSRSSQE
jgi:hypothetical protein